MDVAHPIFGIIPTLEAAVLEVLAGTTRAMSGREIARLAGAGSVAGIWRAAARLVVQGVVLAEQHAGVTLYTANRDHLAWPAVETLVDIRARLMGRISETVAGWPAAPLHVSLFGSAARRDGDSSSDIDMLLIRPDSIGEDDERWAAQVGALRDSVFAWTGNRCQVFEVGQLQFADHVRTADPLVDAWRRDGIRLFGTDIESLVRTAKRG
jgi:hypothetical protein